MEIKGLQDNPETSGLRDNSAILLDDFDSQSTLLQNDDNTHYIFTFESRYSSDSFQGIMPDTGASGISTVGRGQFRALQKILPELVLQDTQQPHKIRFGKGDTTTEGTIEVPTPLS